MAREVVATMTKDEQIEVLTRTIAEYQEQLRRERSIASGMESINAGLRKRLDEMEADDGAE